MGVRSTRAHARVARVPGAHRTVIVVRVASEVAYELDVPPGMRWRARADAALSENAPGCGTMRLRGELLNDDKQSVMKLFARGNARVGVGPSR